MSDDDRPAIAGIGAYAPRFRLSAEAVDEALGRFAAAGIDRTAVPDADEDALTMAHEAATRALDAAGATGADVADLAFATTTPPMEEEDLTPRLASTLGAPGTRRTRTFTGSTRAGGQALDAVLDAGPWGDSIGLVVASDCPRGAPDSAIEHAAGAGAAALVLDGAGPGAVRARGSAVEPYPGTRFRPAGELETTGLGITGYDREAFTAVLGSAAEALALPDGTEFDAAAVQAPDGKLPYRAAKPLGVDSETIARGLAVDSLGDTGAASPLLGLATAAGAEVDREGDAEAGADADGDAEAGVEADGDAEAGPDADADAADRVLLAAYGSGAGATLFALEGIDAVPVQATLAGDTVLSYTAALRLRGTIGREEPEGGGAYVSVPTWQRSLPQRHRLVAGECPDCGALRFPPEGACTACGTLPERFDPVELPGTGTVEATTTIARGGAPPEFVEQQSRSGPYDSAIVAFDGPDGDRTVSVPTQVLSRDDEEIEVGHTVEATIRRIYAQEGVVRYGFKAELAGSR